MNQIQTTLRKGTLEELATLLRQQHAHRLDVIVPAAKVRAVKGDLVIADTDSIITETGVSSTSGTYRSTQVCDEGIAEKLKIPVAYLRRCREENWPLYDQNVNKWLELDSRSFLIRCFKSDEDALARAFLSSSYKMIDNFDVLTASLDGIRQAGHEVVIKRCDLTDRRMYVTVEAPELQVWAGALLTGYRDPRGNGIEKPYVSGGLRITNSETGGGAFTIAPFMTVLICKNGMTITKDAVRAVHLGGKQEDGIVKQGSDTLSKELELVTLRARDAVATFLDADYMRGVISRLTEKAGRPMGRDGKPVDEQVRTVCKQLKFSEETTSGVLDHFIRGGQTTAGGVMQAVTSYAQDVDDADLAAELEGSAEQVLHVAATV